MNARVCAAEQRGRERDAAPAVRAVRDGDDVGVERGDLLGRRQLAARRARVPEVHHVESVSSRRDGRPRARRPARDPAFGDRVAVRDPPGTPWRRRELAAVARRRRGRAAASPRGGTPRSAGRGRRRASRSSANRADPGPEVRRHRHRLVAGDERERGARALAAVAEVVGLGLVVELERLGGAHELEPHADRQPCGAHRVAGQAVEVGGVGARVRQVVGARPRVAAQERLRRHRSQIRHRVRELGADAAVDARASARSRTPARSDARNSSAAAMSAGCATRRSGVLTMLRCSPSSPRNAETRGVHTTPGATAFTRMPDGPSSTAPVRTSDISPAFAAPYAEWRGADVMPDTDATNTIAPPWSRMARPPYCMARNAWRNTMSKCQFHSSSVRSTRSP